MEIQNINRGNLNSSEVQPIKVEKQQIENQAKEKEPKEKFNRKDIEKAVEKANEYLSNTTHLKFEIHEKTNDVMIKIINDKTGEILKEIPPKKIIDMIASMMEVFGIFVDEKR
ncbi:flagellar protein FlaG [Caloramator mitchellensis]|uniref:Flagellar protein FlaG n=1 Tax=Caloramator mitchellensis TaxID=908809 RepID=A0A0R3JU55_CALMK|nr:flagellar protein FlaG [Caloramator mitchellensis]KRQ87067.1 flagellar protein FlaG [Caloramator mitchellensis]